MIWWHREGQKVVCVERGHLPMALNGFLYLLKPKEIYRIRSVVIHGLTGLVGLRLDGITLPSESWCGEGCFDARRFRPVRETSIEQFQSLLTSPDLQKTMEEA